MITYQFVIFIIFSGIAFSEDIVSIEGLKAEHSVESRIYTQGQILSITTDIEYSYTNIAVIGLEIAIPDQWTFDSYIGASPITAPRKGEKNLLSFSWTTIPNSRLTIQYQLNIPTNEIGEKQIASLVKYRLGTIGEAFYAEVLPDPLTLYSKGYFITASSGQNGSITPEGLIYVLIDDNQSFSIQPDIGYTINSLIIDSQPEQPVNEYTFKSVTSNHTIDVSFVLKQYQIVISSNDGGNVAPSGALNVAHGTSQSFQIIPDMGYDIDHVTANGIPVSIVNNQFLIQILSNTNINVQFKKKSYIINSDCSDNGMISPSGIVNVYYDDHKPFIFTPDQGYHLFALFIDDIDKINETDDSQYIFESIKSNHTIHAWFALADPIEIIEPGVESSLVYSMPLPSVTVNDIEVVSNQHIDIQSKNDDIMANVFIETGSVLVESAQMALFSYTFREGVSESSSYINQSNGKLLEINLSYATISEDKGIILTIPSNSDLDIDDFMGDKPHLSIFHASEKAHLYQGNHIESIPPQDILNIDSLGGSITFRARSLSIFSVGTNVYNNETSSSESDDSGGGCFIESIDIYIGRIPKK